MLRLQAHFNKFIRKALVIRTENVHFRMFKEIKSNKIRESNQNMKKKKFKKWN